MLTLNWPCCCPTTECYLTGSVQGCVDDVPLSPLEGATVTATDSGGATVGSTTTDSSGGWAIPISTSGDYTVSASKDGYCTVSALVHATCPGSVNGSDLNLPLAVLPVSVWGCIPSGVNPIVGGDPVTVTVRDSGGSVYWTGTVDSTGTILASVPCTYPFTVTVSCPPRFADSSQTIVNGLTHCHLTFALGAADGYVCIPCCVWPVKATLYLTDPVFGPVTLHYWGMEDGFCGGFATSFASFRGTLTADDPAACSDCPPTPGLVLHYDLLAGGSSPCASCDSAYHGFPYFLKVTYPASSTGGVVCPDSTSESVAGVNMQATALDCPLAFSLTFPAPFCTAGQGLYNGGDFIVTE